MNSTATDRLPKFRAEDGIGFIQLDDPATLNSLSPAAFARLGAIYAEIGERAHKDVHALVLTGSGKAFCAGAELKSMFMSKEAASASPAADAGPRMIRWMQDEGMSVVMAWNEAPVPVVTAVNGVAAGIGVSLALAGDIVIAARSASFVIPFMGGLGIVPDGGLTWQLPRLVGHARSMALTLLGDRISAEQAESSGLIWKCVDDDVLQTAAVDLARRLTELPRYAVRELRGVYKASWGNEFRAQCNLEVARNTQLAETAEFREALSAFFQKRKPRFHT